MVARSILGSLAFTSLAAAGSVSYGSPSSSTWAPIFTDKPSPSACSRKTTTITKTVTVDEASSVVVKTWPTPISYYPPGGPNAHKYTGPAFLPSGSNLKPSLSPEQQNGACPLGLPDAPKYGGPIPGDGPGSPWGNNPPWKGNPKPPHGGGHSTGKPTKGPGGPTGYPPSSYPTGKPSGKPSESPSGKPSGKPSDKPSSSYSDKPSKTSSVPSSTPSTPTNGTDDCVLIDPFKVPDTGKTRKYNFEISYREIAPDGVKKQGLVINGGFPGPTIEANWGDWIEVTVKNNLQGSLGDSEGTSIHWHGLFQKETPFMDGVPGVTQCPIVPGQSFTYRFKADQYGTSWYHSHYSAQYSGGIYGAMIIHGPADTPECLGYDEDLGPVLVGDWYHDKYYDLVALTMNSTTGLPPLSNSNLVNGRANYPCANTTQECTPNAGLSKFKFESGKKYRLRLINPSSDALQRISIDGHKMTVVAQDFVPIIPFETDLVTLAVGQRSDVIVEAVGKPTDSFFLRSTLGVGQTACSLPDGIAPNATAVIYYEDADPNAVPTSESDISSDRIYYCGNDPLPSTTPLYPISSTPDGPLFEQTFNIDFFNNGTNFLWAINNISARVDYGVSQLLDAVQGDLIPQPQWNLYTLPNTGTVRLIMYNSFFAVGHPMHLHGHDFQVLAEGFGVWDGTITQPENPVRRDVQFLQKAQPDGTRSYTVIQFKIDNPTINIIHCHLAWHVSGGLYAAFVEAPDEIKKLQIPDSIKDTCKKWESYEAVVVPNQIDSGV